MNGARAEVTEANGVAAASSNTTWQRLLPPAPVRANSVAVVPAGPVSVPTRSPTNVWPSPTVVAPPVVVQVPPSIENVSREAYPIPETAIVTDAPAALASGIGTGGPA